MKEKGSLIWRTLFILLFLCAGGISLMAYNQIITIKTERTSERTSWLPKDQIQRLMRYHGTKVLKITQEEVYILRDSKWIPVFKRVQG